MADKNEVKKMLDKIESDRKLGRVTTPPTRLAKGNLLGGRTAAFHEAVKTQGKMLHPDKGDPNYTQSGEVFAEAERLEKARKLRK